MTLLTNEQEESNGKAKICYICREKFEDKYDNNKKYRKVRDPCNYTGKCIGAAHSICHLKHSIPKEITIIFHNGSNYVCHFIIKELAEKFEGQFTCLGEVTEKYIYFSFPVEKEV